MTAFKELDSHPNVAPDKKTNLFRRITNSPIAQLILPPLIGTAAILGVAHYSGASASEGNNAEAPVSGPSNRSSKPPITNGPEVPAPSPGGSEPPLAAITTPGGDILYRNPSLDASMSEDDRANGGKTFEGQNNEVVVYVEK